METKFVNNKPLKKSLKEYARGLAGGLIFSLPLLYTMEIWWAGFISKPVPLLLMIVFTFLLLLGYNRFAGVREDNTLKEILVDSVEELGLGLVVSFLILLMLDRVNPPSMHFNESMGKVVIEAMAVSIGISVGRQQLGSGSGGSNKQGGKQQQGKKEEGSRDTIWGITVLSVCGSIFIASNVAPTQEILLLGVEAEPVNILVLALVSLFISVLIVYFSDFRGAPKGKKGFDMVINTSISYLAALATSAFLLWFFDRFDHLSLFPCVAQVIVLGFPASLGASAGRLLIK